MLEWKTGMYLAPKHDTLYMSESHRQCVGQYSTGRVTSTVVKIIKRRFKSGFIVRAVIKWWRLSRLHCSVRGVLEEVGLSLFWKSSAQDLQNKTSLLIQIMLEKSIDPRKVSEVNYTNYGIATAFKSNRKKSHQ